MLQVLLGVVPPPLAAKESLKLHRTTKKVLTKVDSIQQQYWSQLAALPAFADRYVEYATTLDLQRMTLGKSPSPKRGKAVARAVGAGPITAVVADSAFPGVIMTAGDAAGSLSGVVNQGTVDSQQTARNEEVTSGVAGIGPALTAALSSPTLAALSAETTPASGASTRSTSPQVIEASVTAIIELTINTPGSKQHAISNTATDSLDSPAFRTRARCPALPETSNTPQQ